MRFFQKGQSIFAKTTIAACISASIICSLFSGCTQNEQPGGTTNTSSSISTSASSEITGDEGQEASTSFSQEGTNTLETSTSNTDASKPEGTQEKETSKPKESSSATSNSNNENSSSQHSETSGTNNQNSSNGSGGSSNSSSSSASSSSSNNNHETSSNTSNNNTSDNSGNSQGNNKTKGDLDGYGGSVKDSPDKTKQTLKIENKTFNVGDTAVATYYISAPYKIIAYQGYIEYNSDCLEATAGTLGEGAAAGGIINHKPSLKGKILFNGSNLSGYNFKKGGVFLTVEYKVKAGGEASPKFVWQELWDNDNNSVVKGKSSNGEILTVSYTKK